MKRILLMAILPLAAFAATPALAQQFAPPPPNHMQFNSPSERPMPMMRNDVRFEHRRQGAKCMNAYPEDHNNFTSCMREERASSPFRGNRRQFMPMSPGESE